MIIKLLIYLLIILLIIVIGSTIRHIYWNRLLNKRQKALGKQIAFNLKYKTRFSLILILFISIIVIRINAADFYISLLANTTSYDCAYTYDDPEAVLEYNPDVFVATIESIEDVKKFDVLNSDHSLLVDKYYYRFNRFATIRGEIEETTIITKSIEVDHPAIKAADLCLDNTKPEVGKTYLMIGEYIDSTEAKRYTDPRSQKGDWYYITQAILLENYDSNKSIDEQTEEIKTIISKYK